MSDDQITPFTQIRDKLNHNIAVVEKMQHLPFSSHPLPPETLVVYFEAMGVLTKYTPNNPRYSANDTIQNMVRHGVSEEDAVSVINRVLALFANHTWMVQPVGNTTGNLLIDWANTLLYINQYEGMTLMTKHRTIFNIMRLIWTMHYEESAIVAPHDGGLIKYYLLIDHQAIYKFNGYICTGNCPDMATAIHSAIDALLPVYKLQVHSPGLDVANTLNLKSLFQRMYVEVNSAPSELYDDITDMYQNDGFASLMQYIKTISIEDLQSRYFVDDKEIPRMYIFFGCIVIIALWDLVCESHETNIAIRNPYVPLISTVTNNNASNLSVKLDEAVDTIKNLIPMTK